MVEPACHDGCPTCAEPAIAHRIVGVLPAERALIDVGDGRTEEISTMLVDAVLGDLVLVHTHEAIAVVEQGNPS